jgi:hypothetical protein
MAGPPAWAARTRNSNGTYVEDSAAPSPFSPGRYSHRSSANGTTNGTGTVGFYGDEDTQGKQREFASDAPFTVRNSQSEASVTGNEDQKHTQDVDDTPEAIAILERYVRGKSDSWKGFIFVDGAVGI